MDNFINEFDKQLLSFQYDYNNYTQKIIKVNDKIKLIWESMDYHINSIIGWILVFHTFNNTITNYSIKSVSDSITKILRPLTIIYYFIECKPRGNFSNFITHYMNIFYNYKQSFIKLEIYYADVYDDNNFLYITDNDINNNISDNPDITGIFKMELN